MRPFELFVLLIALLALGCGKESTADLIEKLKSPEALTRLKAVRTLPERSGDAAQIVPALIEALKDEDEDVRRGAAFGLGSFGEQARQAIPALQAALRDRDSSVRKAAAVALSYIDPRLAPKTAPPRPRRP
jgi:HEAT repeat protein